MKKIFLILTTLILAFATSLNAKEVRKPIKKKQYVHKSVYKKAKRKPKLQQPRYINTTANVLLVNLTDNSIVQGNQDNYARSSIASISKLMTVYTVLKSNQNLNEVITVQSNLGNHTRLSKGMQLTRIDLVNLSLVHSDNLAAMTLAQNYPGGFDAFISEMNKNARELGMNNTVFYEPTGLDANNTSTLSDITQLTKAASHYPIFREAASMENVTVTATKGKKTYKIRARPTSAMFGKEGVVTIKTGFTNAAGFCITMLVNSQNKLFNVVILGARSSKERSYLIEKSMKTIHNYGSV